MTFPTHTDLKPELGTEKEDIETPAILVDLDIMEKNIQEYAEWADKNNVRLRSHAKTHKIPDISHTQNRITNGGGILCQTLSEAEVMAYNGIDDIYLSYMVVSDQKCDRLVRLSEKINAFSTTVDGLGNIDPLQKAGERHGTVIDVILEIDTGLNRVGVPQGEEAVELAEYINKKNNLNFEGIMAYESQIKRKADRDREKLDSLAKEVMDETAETVKLIEEKGIPVEEVKTGGTVTSKFSGKHPIVTEINPGMYPFNDATEMHYRPWEVDKEDVSLTIVTTVISKPSKDRIVVDAGSKSISLETSFDPIPKYADNLNYYRASEEHGWIKTTGDYNVGDKVEFIAPHVCPTINLHNSLIGTRDGQVEEVWDVAARGKVK